MRKGRPAMSPGGSSLPRQEIKYPRVRLRSAAVGLLPAAMIVAGGREVKGGDRQRHFHCSRTLHMMNERFIPIRKGALVDSWYVKNILMAVIIGVFVSWWRNTGRVIVGRKVSKLGPVTYFIHSSPSYGHYGGEREQTRNEEKAYGRWKRMDDAGETIILFFFAAVWTSEDGKKFSDSLPVELLLIVASALSIAWYKWMRKTPSAPSVEDDTG